MTQATTRHVDSQEMICPTCSARQVWSDECRRCKTDLTLLGQVWQTAEAERRRCLRELSSGRPRQALRYARRYAAVVGHAEASRLLGVCELLNEDWPSALRNLLIADSSL